MDKGIEKSVGKKLGVGEKKLLLPSKVWNIVPRPDQILDSLDLKGVMQQEIKKPQVTTQQSEVVRLGARNPPSRKTTNLTTAKTQMKIGSHGRSWSFPHGISSDYSQSSYGVQIELAPDIANEDPSTIQTLSLAEAVPAVILPII